MKPRIAQIALLVRDYDEAIAWFARALGFVLLEDNDLGGGKRWVRIAPTAGRSCGFFFSAAAAASSGTSMPCNAASGAAASLQLANM